MDSDYISYSYEQAPKHLKKVINWANKKVFYKIAKRSKNIRIDVPYVLAGGALTAYFTKKKPKDYDLYLIHNSTIPVGFNTTNSSWRYGMIDKISTSTVGLQVWEPMAYENENLEKVPLLVEVYTNGRDSQSSINTNSVHIVLPKWKRIPTHGFNEVHYDLIIRQRFESVPEILDSFDFSVCKCAITSTGEIWFHKYFFDDLKQRRLRYLDNTTDENRNPIVQLFRTLRYRSKGFQEKDKSPILIKLGDLYAEIVGGGTTGPSIPITNGAPTIKLLIQARAIAPPNQIGRRLDLNILNPISNDLWIISKILDEKKNIPGKLEVSSWYYPIPKKLSRIFSTLVEITIPDITVNQPEICGIQEIFQYFLIEQAMIQGKEVTNGQTINPTV